ncbi:GDSL-type esterase/lipase family protein [Tuberibacillus sp. Marseille-P3662]|uniref:GDSL-type esterase/lipase family protein n=1 Tax=Tuberibacillus sp. Marseille-P3662 TaxID=1965358 RepID=UPI000A1CA3BA|nr:GDSL-type esterase/lipase family protein [Tuberibacillus sp. Marseille-P3662]
MIKKIFLSLLIGTLAISTAACGSKQNEKQSVSTDEEDYDKSVFSNSVFYGDSLFKRLSELLKDSNVISNAGATAQFAVQDVDQIAKREPQNVFILLGSDDILMPVDYPIKNSMSHYATFIKKIKKQLPDTKIHVLSVTPVTKEAIKKEPRYKNIPDYNKALKKMATKEKVDYIDLYPMFKKHQNLHSKDGVHFKADFYPLLLNYIEKQIQSSKKQ